MALQAEVLFVNPDYLKRLTQLNGAVEEASIVPSIILAQDKYLQQYLGTELLQALKTKVSGGTLSGAYTTLMDDYVRKVVVWWTMVELLPNLYVQVDNGGLVIRTAENTAAIGSDDLHRQVENARQNAQFYTTRMVEYLTANVNLFNEYNNNGPADMLPERNAYFQNGLSISIGSGGLDPRIADKYIG